ncbi:MAG: lanthionine synthetase LanC family protein [Vicinamibacterales bacterium]
MRTLGLLVLALATSLAPRAQQPSARRPYLDAALDIARWIEASAIRTEHGVTWPADPNDPKSVSTTLYSGSPGVVLFLLELHRATGDQTYLDRARLGADHLVAGIDDEKETGLYTGLAGIGYTLVEIANLTREAKYRDGARKAADRLRALARPAGKGVEWNDVTDIVGGSAGTGLFLLYAAKELEEPAYQDLATKAGHRLIELARREGAGEKWAMSPAFPRLMPNFSHGTAGIAYFLATLSAETAEPVFLEHAIAGAGYLQSIAKTEGEVCLIFHNEPDGRDLHYLSWCHGPPGTARLFYRLHQITKDAQWMEWVHKAARGVMASGIPEARQPGYWNNVSQCCGDAGVAMFFIDIARVSRRQDYLAFAQRTTEYLMSRGTRDDKGLRWVQAENRTQPEKLVAQTGYMQGGAGMGMLLLRVDGMSRRRRLGVIFPDNPFE